MDEARDWETARQLARLFDKGISTGSETTEMTPISSEAPPPYSMHGTGLTVSSNGSNIEFSYKDAPEGTITNISGRKKSAEILKKVKFLQLKAKLVQKVLALRDGMDKESKVDQIIGEWQNFNDFKPQSSYEIFQISAYQECVVIKALCELNSLELDYFKSRLDTFGFEVHCKGVHALRVERFTSNLPENYRKLLVPGSGYHKAHLFLQSLEDRFERKDLPLRPLAEEIDRRAESELSLQEYEHFRSLKTVSKLPAVRWLRKYFPPCEEDLEASRDYSHPVEVEEIPGFLNISKLLNPVEFGDTISDSETSSETLGYSTDSGQDAVNFVERRIINQTDFFNMAVTAEINLPLPVLSSEWVSEKDFKALGRLSPATERSIEPVGPHFLAHARRARHKRTFSEDDRIQAQENVKKVEDDDLGEISESEDPMMLARDAKDWKGQDHYAVLGLSKYRHKATEEQIKRAHRKKVLRHHPDKKAAAGSTEDDNFFKCIQKAVEILLDPVKRKQYDSVDEHADVEPPTKKQAQKGNFYKLWAPVFKAEGRFSRIQPVPKFGDDNSSREDVENFYNFWYNFDSWRSFEYLDEDVPDDNENRDQKRHMERKNNNARKKRKTEDSARLRKLLDDCSALDERIKKFRQEASANKNKKRLEKEAAEKKAAEEAKTKKEADEAAAKAAEEAAKTDREAGKKAKEAAKNAVKKNKRIIRGSVKDANYFAAGEPSAIVIDGVLNDVELVQGKIDPDEIAALAGKLNGLKVADEIKNVWSTEVNRLVEAGKLKEGDAKTLTA